jgi:hypothetical protein
VGVAAKIPDDLLRAPKRALGVDDPAGVVERWDIDGAEIELAALVSAFESGHYVPRHIMPKDSPRATTALHKASPVATAVARPGMAT